MSQPLAQPPTSKNLSATGRGMILPSWLAHCCGHIWALPKLSRRPCPQKNTRHESPSTQAPMPVMRERGRRRRFGSPSSPGRPGPSARPAATPPLPCGERTAGVGHPWETSGAALPRSSEGGGRYLRQSGCMMAME